MGFIAICHHCNMPSQRALLCKQKKRQTRRADATDGHCDVFLRRADATDGHCDVHLRRADATDGHCDVHPRRADATDGHCDEPLLFGQKQL